jgi:cytoskeletal protein RodZ
MTGSSGFWDRVDALFARVEQDPEFRARLFVWLWWISVAFVVFGLGVILWVSVGNEWPPDAITP